MKCQVRIGTARQLAHEQQPEGLLAGQPRPPRLRIRRTARIEVLLNPGAQRRLFIEERAHRL